MLTMMVMLLMMMNDGGGGGDNDDDGGGGGEEEEEEEDEDERKMMMSMLRRKMMKLRREDVEDISQEPFWMEIYGGNGRTLPIPPRLNTGALTPAVRTPQCGHTIWGTIPTTGRATFNNEQRNEQ